MIRDYAVSSLLNPYCQENYQKYKKKNSKNRESATIN